MHFARRFQIIVPLAVLVTLGAVPGLIATAGAAPGPAGSLEGTISTPGILSLDGQATLETAGPSAIHLSTASLGTTGFSLDAEKVEVEVTWRVGYRSTPGEPLPDNRLNGDSGQSTTELLDVEGRVELTEPGPFELLAAAKAGEASLQSTSSDTASLRSFSHATVTAYEWSPDARSTGETNRPGFWYTTGPADVGATGLETATLTGDFTLFLNNATIRLERPGGAWENWTGVRSEELAPGTVSREVRATVLHIEGGHLTLDAPGEIEVYTPEETEIDAAGVVRSERVVGQLIQDARTYTFAPAPLELAGEGMLSVRSTGAPATEQTEVQAPGQTSLELSPRGSFTVAETAGVQVERVPPSGSGGLASLLSMNFLAGAFAALAAVSAVGLGWAGWRTGRTEAHTEEEDIQASPASEHERLDAPGDEAADPSRRAAFKRTLDHGRALYDDLDFEGATRVFRELGQAYPAMPEPWVYLGDTLMELGRYPEAATAYQRFEQAMDQPEPDALGKQVRAFTQAGDHQAAADVLERLADTEPAMAAREVLRRPDVAQIALSSDLSLGLDMLDTWIRGAWARDRRDEAARVFVLLIEREPHMAFHYCLQREYDALCQRVLPRLDPAPLRTLVEVLWHTDRLDLASDALLHLAKQDAQAARKLLEDAVYAPLRDDVRVSQVVGR